MAALARNIPMIHAYVGDEIDPAIETDRQITESIAAISRMAELPGPSGLKAKAALRELHQQIVRRRA